MLIFGEREGAANLGNMYNWKRNLHLLVDFVLLFLDHKPETAAKGRITT